MHKFTRKNPRKQHGFTLLELLIALLVLSIGLLGLAALQTVGLRSNQMASMRTVATQMTYDMTDRMRANPDGLTTANQYYVLGTGEATPTIVTDCDAEACTTAELADFDLAQWRTRINSLPGGLSQVTQTTTAGFTTHTVTVHWNESRDPAVNGLDCPPLDNTDLRCVQFTL